MVGVEQLEAATTFGLVGKATEELFQRQKAVVVETAFVAAWHLAKGFRGRGGASVSVEIAPFAPGESRKSFQRPAGNFLPSIA